MQSYRSNSAHEVPNATESRREFLGSFTTLAMAGGLAAGYGTFFVMAGQYLYPNPDPGTWYFVARAEEIEPDASVAFESPSGLKVVVKRQGVGEPREVPAINEFIALSSTCPHLGCRVHWEAQNNRFFCPCHNGQFDAKGKPTGGPPLAANQHLPQYELMLDDGMLFIRMPTQAIRSEFAGGRQKVASGRRNTAEDRA